MSAKLLLTFGGALAALKAGAKAARHGWDSKDMFVFLVPGSAFKVSRPPLLGIYAEGTEISYHAHIDMKTADGKIVPWLASQTDVLAEDWYLLEQECGECRHFDEGHCTAMLPTETGYPSVRAEDTCCYFTNKRS